MKGKKKACFQAKYFLPRFSPRPQIREFICVTNIDFAALLEHHSLPRVAWGWKRERGGRGWLRINYPPYCTYFLSRRIDPKTHIFRWQYRCRSRPVRPGAMDMIRDNTRIELVLSSVRFNASLRIPSPRERRSLRRRTGFSSRLDSPLFSFFSEKYIYMKSRWMKTQRVLFLILWIFDK